MSLLRSLARHSARATGRALSAHVVPDSLIPSWKTKKRVSSGLSLLTKAARKTKPATNRPASASGGKRKGGQPARPAPKAPKTPFDKNAWSQGRALASPPGFAEPRPSRPASSSGPLLNKSGQRLVQQFSDLRRHPKAVAQMGLDLLHHEYQQKKQRFLSSLPSLRKK